MKETRKRIADSDLAFYENTIALMVGIHQACKRLTVNFADEPDALEEILRIVTKAGRAKQMLQERKKQALNE